MFRGREQAHPERGRMLLQRLFDDLDGLGVIEQNPLQEGRNMHMLLAPSKEALREAKGAKGDEPAWRGARRERSRDRLTGHPRLRTSPTPALASGPAVCVLLQ